VQQVSKKQLSTSEMELLYFKYKNLVKYVIHNLGAIPQDKEDLVSEIFLRILSNHPSINNDHQARKWITTVTKNHFINFSKTIRKTVSLDQIEDILCSQKEEVIHAFHQQTESERLNVCFKNLLTTQ
jgi:DNA-directed RNA polymerase specialized sigma24 family protein